jgi:Cu+-exporting ATPase
MTGDKELKKMFRRHFIQGITLAGSALATAAAESGHPTSVVYHVKGFSCVTCAVGLETMLKREKGILRVEASYPEAIARIDYDPGLITEEFIRASIGDMGFSVAGEHGR